MTCPSCWREAPSDAAFCGGCGVALGPPTLADERFGAPLSYVPGPLAERILAARSAVEGERKTVSALFLDVVGSTGIAERIGAERTAALMERLFAIALERVHRYEGTVTQFLGDGFMALFGAPLAHEDHAERAVRAAWEIQQALNSQPIQVPDGQQAPLRLRIGCTRARWWSARSATACAWTTPPSETRSILRRACRSWPSPARCISRMPPGRCSAPRSRPRRSDGAPSRAASRA